MLKKWLLILLTCCTCCSGALAQAQSYPNKTVRLVVPFPPGGATDIVARLVADQLTKQWGQSMVVDNRSGASGMIGAELVAKSAPDGYTLLMGTLVTNVISHYLFDKVPFSPDAFAPVTLLTTTPNILLANNTLPVSTIQELIAYAKANPNKVTYSSAGIGLSGHLGMELFASAVGLKLVHVPFRGSAPSNQAFAAGQVNLTLDLVPTATIPVKAGEAKPLAVASAARVRQFPNVPTFVELGYKSVQAYTWNGLMAPAGTPKPVIDRIQRDAQTALKTPELRDRLAQMGADVIGGTPEEFGELIRQERDRWGPVIRNNNIRAE